MVFNEELAKRQYEEVHSEARDKLYRKCISHINTAMKRGKKRVEINCDEISDETIYGICHDKIEVVHTNHDDVKQVVRRLRKDGYKACEYVTSIDPIGYGGDRTILVMWNQPFIKLRMFCTKYFSAIFMVTAILITIIFSFICSGGRI